MARVSTPRWTLAFVTSVVGSTWPTSLRPSGANLVMPPETRDYGLRHFNAEDADGNTITIGSVTEEA